LASLKLETKSYEFLKLEDQYMNLDTPAFEISVEGKDIVEKEYMAISNLSVETSIKASDFATFDILNAYDYDESFFKWTDKYLVVGKKIEIKFGYVDKLLTVFEGYITKVSYEFQEGEGPALKIYCMDPAFLMMKGKKTKIWAKKKHSDIVKEIAGNYKLKSEITATATEYETLVQRYQSDYEFIQHMAELNGYEFFLVGQQVYFRKLNEEKTSVITLEIGINLLNFDYAVDLASQIGSVVVKGYNKKQENLEGKSAKIDKLGSGKKDGVSEVNKLNKTDTVIEIYEPVVTKKEAEDIAKAQLNSIAMSYVTGSGSTFGLPEIRAGRYLEIKGMWKTEKRLFYITDARHELDEGGYKTHFTLEGNAI